MLRSGHGARWLGIGLAVIMLLGCSLNQVAAENKKWTVMVFINGDNNLEGSGLDDINEMETAGSTDDINILVQFDRAAGFSYADGDWTSTRRYYITKDDDPHSINSELLRDLGEVDTGDYRSLVDFARWGMTEYPAERLMLVVWNHGTGWKKKAEEPIFKGISYDDTSGNHMTTQDLETALKEIVELRNGQKLDLLGMDACLMQMIEVSYQIREFVDICVASEEVEPSSGWPYDQWLPQLAENPEIDARALGAAIVETYIDSYSGGPAGNQAVTQSAIDCSKLAALVASIDALAGSLLENIKLVGRFGECMRNTQKFYHPENKDLGDFARQISESIKSGSVHEAAVEVREKLAGAVIANGTNGSRMVRSTGIAMYFPTKHRYEARYEKLAFSRACRWDEFLRATFNPPIPILSVSRIKAVDAGEDGKVSPGESVTLDVMVKNTGGAASSGAEMKLTCRDERVTVTTPSIILGTIGKGATGVFSGLTAEISESFPANQRVTFIVSLEDEGQKLAEKSIDALVRKPFSVTSNILLVVKNSGDKESACFSGTLDALKVPYDLWDIDIEGGIGRGTLIKYLGGIVIRSCPDNTGTGKIGPNEQKALTEYLSRGGSLFLSGQDIGYGLSRSALYRDYLHAAYVQDSTGIHDIDGLADTPFAGLAFRIVGGTGADNQRWPDEIDPLEPAVSVLRYVPGGAPVRYSKTSGKAVTSAGRGTDSSGSAGIFVQKNGFKALYLAFGFEGIAGEDARKAFMRTALDMLSSSFHKKLETLLGMEQTRHEFGTASLKVSRSIVAEVMQGLDHGALDKLDSFIEFLGGLDERELKAFRPATAVIRERAISGTMTDSPLAAELRSRINRLNELSR